MCVIDRQQSIASVSSRADSVPVLTWVFSGMLVMAGLSLSNPRTISISTTFQHCFGPTPLSFVARIFLNVLPRAHTPRGRPPR